MMEAYGADSVRKALEWANAHGIGRSRFVALVRDGGGWVLVYWTEADGR